MGVKNVQRGASSSTSNARDSEKSADDIDLSMSSIVDSDNGADSDDSSDNTMSLSSVYSNASRPCSTLANVSDSECALVNLDCINNLTLMSIESDLLNDIDFNDIISDFASRKSRSVPI